MQLDELQNIISNGTSIQSSGTTGTPKVIEQTPAKLKAADEVLLIVKRLLANLKFIQYVRQLMQVVC